MAELSKNSNVHLITGMAGAGKSTSRVELEKRGFEVLNLDPYPNLAYWGTDDGEAAEGKKWDDPKWLRINYWRWRADTLRSIILNHDSRIPLFLDGRARNQEEFFGWFSSISLLRISEATMRARLNHQSRGHSFGQDPVTQDFLVESLPAFEEKALRHGAKPIGTDNLLVDEVVGQILIISGQKVDEKL